MVVATPVVLTVYVDEVSSLLKAIVPSTTRTLYDVFLSAWVNATHDQPAVLVTLSTNFRSASRTPSLPPVALHPSQQAIVPSTYHHAPFTELVFDMIPTGTFLFGPGQHSLSDVANVGFMVRFGRPLYVLPGLHSHVYLH